MCMPFSLCAAGHAPAKGAATLTVQGAWLEEVDQLNMATSQVLGAPAVAVAIRRLNCSALLRWATSTIGNPVSRYISVDMQNSARQLVRRGLTDLAFAATRSA